MAGPPGPHPQRVDSFKCAEGSCKFNMETKQNGETTSNEGKQDGEGEDKSKVAEAIFAKYNSLLLFISYMCVCLLFIQDYYLP